MDDRLRDINSKQTKDLGLYVVVVYHHEGALENRVRGKLDAWGCRSPPPEYGIKGIEFRVVNIDMVKAAMDEVKKECEGPIYVSNAPVLANDCEGEAIYKQRRLDLQLRKEEFEFEQMKRNSELDLEEKKFEFEQKKRSSELDFEFRQIDVEAKKRSVLSN